MLPPSKVIHRLCKKDGVANGRWDGMKENNNQTEWFIQASDDRGVASLCGPFSPNQIKALLKTGEITNRTLIRLDDGPWQPLRDVPVFVGVFLNPVFCALCSVVVLLGGLVIAVLINNYPRMFSRAASLTVPAAPALTLNGPTTCIAGKSALYSATADSTLPLTIDWDVHGVKYSGGTIDVTFPVPGTYTITTTAYPTADPNSKTTRTITVTVSQYVVRNLLHEILTGAAVIAVTNTARAIEGLPPLVPNPHLNAIAEARTRDMSDKQYLARTSSTGEQATTIAKRLGYSYNFLVENIAAGNFSTNRMLVDGWMQNPVYKKNILSQEAQEIGVAVVKGTLKGKDVSYAVQIFGRQSATVPVSQSLAGTINVPGQTCVPPSGSLLTDIERGKSEVVSMFEQSERMQKDLSEEKKTISDYQKSDSRSDLTRRQEIIEMNATYNENRGRYKRVMADTNAKRAAINALVVKYNSMVKTYQVCQRRVSR